MTASITPFLWFTDDCEKAVDFYLGIFKDGQRHETMTANAAGPWPAGTIVYRAFTINGQRMIAFTGGPGHEFMMRSRCSSLVPTRPRSTTTGTLCSPTAAANLPADGLRIAMAFAGRSCR